MHTAAGLLAQQETPGFVGRQGGLPQPESSLDYIVASQSNDHLFNKDLMCSSEGSRKNSVSIESRRKKAASYIKMLSSSSINA